MDSLRKYPEIPVEFENDYIREFMVRYYAGELGPDITKKINDGTVRINDIQLYKRLYIGSKTSVTPLFISSDQMVDGVCLFNANKIPKDSNFLLTHISLKHANNSGNTTDPATTAMTAALLATNFYHNLIPFIYNYVNAAAATPTIGKTERDVTGKDKVPEELLAADLIVQINGVTIFRRDVRSMFFDTRYVKDIDISKGIELSKKVIVKEDQVINAYLNFPSGVTIPAYGSGATTHCLEFCMWGVGTSIKG